jgi:hypothetical protein
VALQMDPERRRKLMELARWHDQWQAEHQVDDAEFVPEGADSERRRPPTPDAERDFMARAREIMGLDPESGHRRQGSEPAPLPVARTRDEAHLHMDMHPCERCGSVDIAWESSLTDRDGVPARRYAGTCGECGQPREFVFGVPDRPTLPGSGDVVVFGGPERSQLLDPGEWLLVADLCAQAAAVPQDGRAEAGGQTTVDSEVRYNLAVAAAAVEEILKFVPPGADAVPEWAFFSDRGLTVYHQEPGRFDRRRLAIVRDTYREALDRT